MNCLQYALEFWDKEPKYRLFYNSEHVINLPPNTTAEGFLSITEFGYNHFRRWYADELINDNALRLLIKYFALDQ